MLRLMKYYDGKINTSDSEYIIMNMRYNSYITGMACPLCPTSEFLDLMKFFISEVLT